MTEYFGIALYQKCLLIEDRRLFDEYSTLLTVCGKEISFTDGNFRDKTKWPNFP